MSLFGTTSPRIKVVSTSAEIDLDYAVIQQNKPVFDRIEQKDPIGYDNQFITNGYWWVCDILVYLFK